jgi:hypothetical protein
LTTDFEDEFQQLWDVKNPVRRGLQFEDLFCRLLFKSGFTVHKNPRSAKPRQTDVLAEHGGDTFLFETKWLNRKVDIEVVGQIKDRLERTPNGTIGCVCSVSGFTETLIRDVEQRRSQFEVLLFNPEEIYGVFYQRVSILELIDNKRRGLRRDGTMWFLGQSPRVSKSRYVEMPPSHEVLQVPNRVIHSQLRGDRSDILFARVPLIFDEYLMAFSLRVQLHSSSVEDLREVFVAAENCLGLGGKGTFGIRQQDSGWFGLGSDHFLKQIARRSQRYRGYKGHIHHSEELAYFDVLNNGGMFLLTGRQLMGKDSRIHSGEVIVRLPGIPVNAEPYNRFVRSLTPDNLVFAPEETVDGHNAVLIPPVKIELEDVVTDIGSKEIKHSGGCVSGIVVKNPFFGNPKRIAKFTKNKELLAFSEPEHLICSLNDWLEVGDTVNHYTLTSLETVTIDGCILLRPRCTWGDLVKRAHPPSRDGLGKIESDWKFREQMVEKITRASKRTGKTT